jgi:hypothetical protein
MDLMPLAHKTILGHVLAHRRYPDSVGEFNVADY